MKRENIDLRIHDKFLMTEIDYSRSEQPIKRSQPDGLHIILYLEKVFTASNIKRYNDKLHYLKAELARQKEPEILAILCKRADELQKFYQAIKLETQSIPFSHVINKSIIEIAQVIKISVLISPAVMRFISIITLTDNLIKQLRIQKMSGKIKKNDLYRQRHVILKKFSHIRTAIFEIEKSHNKLIEKAKKI